MTNGRLSNAPATRKEREPRLPTGFSQPHSHNRRITPTMNIGPPNSANNAKIKNQMHSTFALRGTASKSASRKEQPRTQRQRNLLPLHQPLQQSPRIDLHFA